MKGITICPNCGQPTLKVKEEAVKNQALNSKKVSSKKAKWSVCVNENCDTVYLQPDTQLLKSDLKQKLFFKNKTDEAMICYCYKITKGEIRLAAENSCKSVGEVYKFLKKSKTGSCSTNNPLGKSCSSIFKFTVDQLKNSK